MTEEVFVDKDELYAVKESDDAIYDNDKVVNSVIAEYVSSVL